MKKKTFFVIGFFFLALTGQSQTIDLEKDKYWIDAGIGSFGTTEKSMGLT
jgi:hypothetical protein